MRIITNRTFSFAEFSTQNDEPKHLGYLLYTKLSLTGNEGEYLRRYKLNDPAYLYHSTADKFFSETQIEAYRPPGERRGKNVPARDYRAPRPAVPFAGEVVSRYWSHLVAANI